MPLKSYMLLFFLTIMLFTRSSSLILGNSDQKYSADEYSQQLIQTQQQFKTKLQQIKIQIANIQQILKDTTITSQVKLVKLTEGIADQRNSLYQIQQILNLPYELRECKCAELDQQTKKSINQKIDVINQRLGDMKNYLRPCEHSSCPQYQQIMIEINQQLNYLENINSLVNSDCKKSQYVFVQERPVGLVDITHNIYKDNLKANNWYYGSTTEQEYMLRRFQLSTKYNLTSCPLDKPYANLLEDICFQCKNGEFFNLGDRNCFSCGGASEYFNKKTERCEECQAHKYYDFTKQQCVGCPSGMILNDTTKECQLCPQGQHLNYQSYKCESCPEEQYYNSTFTKCMACEIKAGYYLNKATMKCQLCPNGLYYSLNLKRCIQCSNGFHYDREQEKCLACPIGQFYQNDTNKCQSCSQGQFYNQDTQKCISCPSGYTYNTAVHICTLPGTVITTDQHCTPTEPYYNKYSQQCFKCPIDQYYDPTTYICKSNNYISVCPPQRPYYNNTRYTCEQCPGDMPHYDPYYHVCDPCNNQQPIYDPETKSCKACPQGQIYDSSSGRCMYMQTAIPVNQIG